jgi:tripartite-type tricarboxylate transporter receptor subunit TctC
MLTVRTPLRQLAFSLLLGLAMAATWVTTGAQGLATPAEDRPGASSDYPTHPIRLVVPMPPGGGTDAWARLVAQRLGKVLGHRIIVDNRPGAGTMIGAEIVARSPADGYTLLVGDVGTFAVNPHLYRKIAYDPVRDFTPVTLTSRHLLVLAVPGKSPLTSVQELIAQARNSPGALNYGSASIGSPHHLAMELLMQTAGLRLNHIPYRGGAPLTADMLGGRLDVAFIDLPSALPHLRSGWLRGLAIVAPERLPYLPDVPTLREQGFAGYEAEAWQGLVAPAGTPAHVVATLNAAYAKVCAEPAVRRRLEMIGIELTPGSPEAFSAYMRAESAKWGALIRDKGFLLD